MIKIIEGDYIAATIFDSLEELHEECEEDFVMSEHYTDEEAVKEIMNGNLDILFLLIERRMRLTSFVYIFNFVHDESKYEFFIDVYSDVEKGFSNIPEEITEKIIELRPKEVIDTLKKYADNKGYLTIYRGNGMKSTPVEQAFSWTLDPNIAKFFANRFDEKGYIYTAKAYIDNVIAYIDRRSESEVLLDFKDIKLINEEESLVIRD